MVGSLAKYVARSPRYILQADDNTLIRLAGPQQIPWEEGTEIQNISLSGLAFSAPADLCPLIGEVVKIQFEVPNASQMACYGLVARLEPESKARMLVGIKFLKMDLPQRLYMTQALSQRLKTQQRRLEHEEMQIHLKGSFPKMIMMYIFLALWIIGLWMWMSGFIFSV